MREPLFTRILKFSSATSHLHLCSGGRGFSAPLMFLSVAFLSAFVVPGFFVSSLVVVFKGM